MENSKALESLNKKRTELSQNIKALNKDLKSIEEAIRIFSDQPPKREIVRRFSNGERPRMVLDALREGGCEMSTTEVSDAIANSKSIEFKDADKEKEFRKEIGKILSGLMRGNLVVRSRKNIGEYYWKLV